MRTILSRALLLYVSVWLIAIGCWPEQASAMLVPSDTAVSGMSVSRGADLQAIQSALESKLVAQRLADVGMTPSDISARLASMTDEQLHQVAQHLDGLQPGGALVLILAIIGAIVVVLALIGLARQA